MIDLRHLSENNENYFSHLGFALKVGLFFLLCGAAFIIHSVLPWLRIPKILNLSEIERRAKRWHMYTLERLFK